MPEHRPWSSPGHRPPLLRGDLLLPRGADVGSDDGEGTPDRRQVRGRDSPRFPTGMGSSVVQLDGLYQLVKHGVAPRAMVVESPDTVLVACAVIMEIPLVTAVDSTFHDRVSDGQQVAVDAGEGWLVVQ